MSQPPSPRYPDANTLASRAPSLAAAVLLPLALVACASDAWKPNPKDSAFLNQVQRVCGTTRIGALEVRQLLDPGPTQSALFVDLTSRFDLGQISAEDYALGVSSALNAERNSPGIRCIVAQKTP